jgi:hypothetical protein
MERPRWLLPFTYGVDMGAIELVADLARRARATLIAVSLIAEPRLPRSRGARLEHIQQSKDFLEAVHWKADRYSIPVERYEVFTTDAIRHIPLLVADLRCDAMILLTVEKREVFLQTHELKSLLEFAPCQLLIIRMAVPEERVRSHSDARQFLLWLRRLWRGRSQHADASLRRSAGPEDVEPLWIRTEGCQWR